jgi:DNA polymerase-3 subunit delta
MHAFDFLSQTAPPPGPLVAIYGGDPFLKQGVMAHIESLADADGDVSRFEGKSAQWRDVHDLLKTKSLFSSGPRLVRIDDADTFVTAHRPQLEKLAAETSNDGLLLLNVSKWPGNTKLAKALAKKEAGIDCGLPEKGGRSKAVDTVACVNWVVKHGKNVHKVVIEKDAADLLLEICAMDFGRVDQELAKLSLYLGEGEKATLELVSKVVAGWKTETIWNLVDAALDGQSSLVFSQLNHLLQGGEHPVALYGQLAWSLRRLAAAARQVEHDSAQGKRASLRDALKAAGVRDFPPGTIQKMETRLKRIGRARMLCLADQLLQLDLSLKGSHSTPTRSRWALEGFLLELAS